MEMDNKVKYIMANVSYFQALKGTNDSKTAAEVGISRQAFHLWRSGESIPTLRTLEKLSNFLGCNIEDLVSKEKPNASKPIQQQDSTVSE
jgi:DNA-binding Xre family transcriptional regulator